MRRSYFGRAGAGGAVFSCVIASTMARSSCGSMPLASSVGFSSTLMSGSTPTPSANQLPRTSYIRNVGTVKPPPSTSSGAPDSPISPPHVRVPTSGPIFASRK